jgi:Zn-dependent protease with chaperone function
MLPVHGFYGHVQRNDWLSVAMFTGFLLALQLIAAVVLFVPLLMLDVEHAPLFNFGGYAKRYASLVCAVGAVAFLVQFFLHVRLVRVNVAFDYAYRWSHPRLCNIVETLAIGAGLPSPKVGIIDTPALNAFACGISQSSAVVVVTSGLIDALDDDELSAVIAHEIAHIRNGDIQLMAAANVMLRSLLYLHQHSMLRIVDFRQVVLIVVLPPFLVLFLVGAFVSGFALLLARVSRLMISSSRELIADAEAVRMTHNPAALVSALRRIEGFSKVPGIGPETDAMMIDGATVGALATHPTISERVDILTRLAGEMMHARDERRDTRSFGQRPAPQRAVFGRRSVAAATISPSPLHLTSRVAADSDVNAFGLTPALGGLLLLGVATLVVLHPNDFKSAKGIMARFDPAGIRNLVAPMQENGGVFRITSDSRLRDKRP